MNFKIFVSVFQRVSLAFSCILQKGYTMNGDGVLCRTGP